MGFAESAFLWALAAGAIPVIIHLLNRQRYRRIEWAAMEFLLAALKKTRRRLQLENLLLLAVRVLILVLLALAFAQPFFHKTPLGFLGTADTHVVLVLDNSYSMAYRGGPTTPMDRAKAAALRRLSTLKPNEHDRVSLVLASESPAALIGEPSSQIERARGLVGELQPSDFGSNVPRTLELVKEILDKSQNQRKEVLLVTDMQRAGWQVDEKASEAFRDLLAALNKAASFTLVDVGYPRAENTAITNLYAGSKIVGTDTATTFYADVRNYGQTDRGAVTLGFSVDNSKQETVTLPVARAGTVTHGFTHIFREPGPHAVAVEIESDNLPADDRRALALDARDFLRILAVDGQYSPETFEDEVGYLRYALVPAKDDMEKVSIYRVEVLTELGFLNRDVSRADLVILANLRSISPEQAKALESYVHSGGGLLIFLGDQVIRDVYNEILYRGGDGLLPAELLEIAGDKTHTNPLRPAKVEYRYPPLEVFAAYPQIFKRLMIFEYYKTRLPLERPELRVPVRLDDAEFSPLLVEKTFGRGRVALLTTSSDDDWNLLPHDQSGAYLIFVDRLAQHLSYQAGGFRNLQVGDSLEYILKPEEYAPRFSLLTPEKASIGLSPQRLQEDVFLLVYRNADRSGLYALEREVEGGPYRTELLSYFAVNVDPEEGDLDRVSAEELRGRWGQSFVFQYQDTLDPAEKQERKPPASRLWKYLLYAVLALVLVESLLAQRLGSYR